MADKRIFDTQKLREEGKDIKSYAGKMFQELKNVESEMNASTKCFDSPAGEDLRKNFKKSSAKFEEFKKLMEDYGTYLEELADQKERLDQGLAGVATQIPQL